MSLFVKLSKLYRLQGHNKGPVDIWRMNGAFPPLLNSEEKLENWRGLYYFHGRLHKKVR